ncbi:MAG TPA: electron transfer flavoprotein subunit alpha/FixB family protein [Ktedonobacteraceae bacterium]|nr:electron transfer flavoprotein subunit alpha/FixB family protein [Ktedonobacteraceae bacterium]
MSEIWAVLEQNEGMLQEQGGELLAELFEMAQRQSEPTTLSAVLLIAPDALPPDTTLLKRLGVQQLFLLEHPSLAYYTTGAYVDALAWLLQQHAPLLLAAHATTNGRDWMPRLAARLHLPFVSGCLGLDLHDDGLFALRSIYEGRAYAQTRTMLHGHTGLATLVPGVRGTPASTRTAAVLDTPLIITRLTPELLHSPEQEQIQHLGIQAPSPEAVELEAAERIVAGGRGIGREGFEHVAAFARLMGAAVGATRVATDRGWIEHARQIGATGKSVHPRLYIACGISGAAQHTSGMRESQTIVAINPDRTAPIFSLADLGLLGDANQILPMAAQLLEKEG